MDKFYKVVKKQEVYLDGVRRCLKRGSIYDDILQFHGCYLEYTPLQKVYPKKGFIFAVESLSDALKLIGLHKYNCEEEPTFEIWECRGEQADSNLELLDILALFNENIKEELYIVHDSIFLKSCTLTRLVISYE